MFFEGAGSGFRVRRFLVLPSGFFFGGLGDLGVFGFGFHVLGFVIKFSLLSVYFVMSTHQPS